MAEEALHEGWYREIKEKGRRKKKGGRGKRENSEESAKCKEGGAVLFALCTLLSATSSTPSLS
jgi:hypothetical protein